jgi:hypothetical protein
LTIQAYGSETNTPQISICQVLRAPGCELPAFSSETSSDATCYLPCARGIIVFQSSPGERKRLLVGDKLRRYVLPAVCSRNHGLVIFPRWTKKPSRRRQAPTLRVTCRVPVKSQRYRVSRVNEKGQNLTRVRLWPSYSPILSLRKPVFWLRS